MERITDEMQSALGKIADNLNLLFVSSRRWFTHQRWGSEEYIHPNTLNALIRHGLVQKKTIEVYELTPTGEYARKRGRFPKEVVVKDDRAELQAFEDEQGK